jgi:hypothetical protein
LYAHGVTFFYKNITFFISSKQKRNISEKKPLFFYLWSLGTTLNHFEKRPVRNMVCMGAPALCGSLHAWKRLAAAYDRGTAFSGQLPDVGHRAADTLIPALAHPQEMAFLVAVFFHRDPPLARRRQLFLGIPQVFIPLALFGLF